MDDSLEQPTTLPSAISGTELDNDDSSGDEDGALDWSSLRLSHNIMVERPVIPKRGEKDYEPTGGPSTHTNTGSNLQKHSLDRARDAMYSALTANRGISSKTVSYGIWYPRTAHVEVALARGTMFAGMGFSNQRSAPMSEGAEASPGRKRVELLPEEALFLIERGSMYCWRANDGDNSVHQQVASAGQAGVALEGVIGSPMSVQQAFAEMICDGRTISLEEYQVFAYLKRLGYVVLRAQRPSGAANYPTADPSLSPTTLHPPALSLIRRLGLFSLRWLRRLWIPFNQSIPWLQPLCQLRSPLLWPPQSFTAIFEKLRVIPAGHKAPLLAKSPAAGPSPYRSMYHVYKPSTPFRKTAPPPPDFYIIVVNARSTPLPTLLEMKNVFVDLSLSSRPTGPKRPTAPTRTTTETPTSWMGWFTGALPSFVPGSSKGVSTLSIRPPNPFPALKAGRKSFIVAAVSGGSISFIKFSEGSFEEWPII